jgi:gamma-glutamyltranspeptidase/glutathione hydrolase
MGFQARPDLTGSFGMCASTHWLASATGQSVLERGGNAFDAAAAAAFVLHVVEPHLNGAGGDLVALVAPASGAPMVLCGQGPAPAAASIVHYRGEGLDLVPGAGALAAAVPGAVEAWLLLLRDYGTWELADVLAYALHYAEVGHQLLPSEVVAIAGVASLFQEHWPSSAELWLPGGAVPGVGSLLRNPAYAATFRRLVDTARGSTREDRVEAARAEWRSGFVASAIDAFVRETPHMHSSGTVHRGVLTGADMAGFSASYEQPVRGRFRGTEILKAGPWSQGPVLLQTLALLDGYSDAELDLYTSAGIHRVLEALKLAFADRDAFYGPALPASVLDILLSPAYADTRRGLITEAASAELRPGSPGVEPYLPPLRAEERVAVPDRSSGEPTVRGDTCHLDIADRWGNVVSATPSGGWLQSSPTIPSLGFALGTRLQMSWLDPASPSALRPGARPRTTLTPSLMVRDGEVVGAFGTPGGDQQDQWQAGFVVNWLAGGMTPQQAIEAPAFHTMSFPGSFWPRTWAPAGAMVEDRLGAAVIAELADRGHRVTLAGDWTLGRLSAVTRDPATGQLSAAANPRGAQGYAVGR